jgi:hypothetical protein
MAVMAVVFKEHTLGLLYEGGVIGPLRASVLKGATFSVHESPFFANEADFRQATKQDFIDFRVSWHPDYLVATE